MGQWSKKVNRHSHDMPETYSARLGDVKEGDEWTCSCGTVLVVTGAFYQPDQRDGDYYTLDWKIVKSVDSGRYAE